MTLIYNNLFFSRDIVIERNKKNEIYGNILPYMSKIVNINNIFSIGYRCNTDGFLIHFLKIRKYSSPFSYMIIDIKTALQFIDNKFENYINLEYIEPGKDTYTFNRHNWWCSHIHKCSKITGDYVDILDMDTVCIWNHHNLLYYRK